MVLSLLIVFAGLFQASAFANTDSFPDLSELQTDSSSNGFYECRWICGKYGVFMECDFDEVVIGACGAKSFANCENKVNCPGMKKIYAAIQCCKVKIAIEEP